MITVVIPTYNGQGRLIKNLTHNLHYLRGCELIVVNDNPSINLEQALAHLKVKLIQNKKNLGFSGAVNKGMLHVTTPYAMLLNDDVVLNNTSWEHSLSLIQKDPRIFAVSFAQREKDARIVGANKIYFQDGFIVHTGTTSTHLQENGWAEGGACIVRTDIFHSLMGFDTLLSPFYWEDVDLSYRAKKRGYRVVFNPVTIVEHHHESTIGSSFRRNFIETIAFRNQLIFTWKNLHSPHLLGRHIRSLFVFMAKALLKGQGTYVKGFIMAVACLRAISKKRALERAAQLKTDEELLQSSGA